MKGSSRVDSPVFRSLPGLKETERSKLSAVPADFADEVNLAANKGQGGKLGLLAKEAGRFLWEQEGRRLVARRQFRGKFLVSARETWESVTRQEPLDPEANLILGSIHQRLGDLTQSDQCLQRVLENPSVRKEDRAEALALRGRNQKAMGRALWENKDQASKRASVIGKGLFALARNFYADGFKCNLDHFYSGLNALSLSVLLIELIGQEQETWKETFDSDAKASQAEEDLKTSRDRLAGAVGISLEAAEEADVNSGNPDIWLAVSKADYLFLTAKRDAAAAAAYERVSAGLQPFERGSVRDQLEMFVELNVRADRARLCLQKLGEPVEPAPALRQVILFTGHMIDKPDRKGPRFPASEELRARAAIEKEVRQLVEAIPGPALGVAGGANGGDILFHEICASFKIPTRVLLTLPEGPFIAKSVAGGGPGWIGRFNSLMTSHPAKNEVQVLSGSEDLPSWMRAPAGYDVWQRTNIWLLEEALSSGAPNLSLIALWDGTDPEISTSEGVQRAKATARLRYRGADSGPAIESHRYRFAAPLGPIEADELTWYLERYIHWPSGVFQERARGIEAKLPQWGQSLFDSLNTAAGRNALEAWKSTPESVERRFTVKIDRELLEGTVERRAEADEAATILLGLPWELIHDGKCYLFEGDHGVRVRRSLPNRNRQPNLATKPPIRVLLVSPRPEDESAHYIDHRVSARPVIEALAELGELAEFKMLDPPTFPALIEELARIEYHVVHFDGHGGYDTSHGLGALCFEDPTDQHKILGRRSHLVTADKIAEVIRGNHVPLFFLEASQTAKALTGPSTSVAGKLLESGVISVVAMSHSVLLETLRRFVSAFYSGLMSGKRVGQAMLEGQRALKTDTWRARTFTGDLHLQDWFVPVLFQDEQDPQLVRELPSKAVRDITTRAQRLALGAIPAEPEHAFVGRSRFLLAAERSLTREHYLVFQGVGGVGKTALAAELARWLVFTRRFERGAFIALDRSGDARAMLSALGDQLIPNYASLAGADPKVAWPLVQRALAEQPTVIVIDNMEPVLEPPVGSEAAATFEPETLTAILGLCRQSRTVPAQSSCQRRYAPKSFRLPPGMPFAFPSESAFAFARIRSLCGAITQPAIGCDYTRQLCDLSAPYVGRTRLDPAAPGPGPSARP